MRKVESYAPYTIGDYPRKGEHDLRNSLREYLTLRKSAIATYDQGVLVCFAGVPSAGKSSLSISIAQSFNFPRVATHEMTELIDPARGMSRRYRRNLILNEYLAFLQDLPFGGCLVFDKGNDRDFDFYNHMKMIFNGSLFLIAIDIQQDNAIKRKKARDRGQKDVNVPNIDECFRQYAEFVEEYRSDISIRVNGDDPLETNINLISQALSNYLM